MYIFFIFLLSNGLLVKSAFSSLPQGKWRPSLTLWKRDFHLLKGKCIPLLVLPEGGSLLYHFPRGGGTISSPVDKGLFICSKEKEFNHLLHYLRHLVPHHLTYHLIHRLPRHISPIKHPMDKGLFTPWKPSSITYPMEKG